MIINGTAAFQYLLVRGGVLGQAANYPVACTSGLAVAKVPCDPADQWQAHKLRIKRL